MKHIKLLILFFLINFYSGSLFASDDLINELKEGGKIVLIRHSFAPGTGDPNNFLIEDCSTQRNLNKRGILQSKAIGFFFVKNRIPIDTVLSSEWCRCADTAFFAFQKYEKLSLLNSFYDSRFEKNKEKQMRELKDFIKQWHGKKNLILITHYVVINELLNVSADSGEIIISDTKFNVIGKLKSKL